MTEHNSEHPDEETFADLPLKMQSALRDAFRSTEPIDTEIDQSILLQAREHLEQTGKIHVTQESQSWSRGVWISIATVAAALFLVASLTMFRNGSDQSGPSSMGIARSTNGAELAREDLDGNGRVDILDAFLLARQLEQGEVNNPAWDLNGDGKVDQMDVQQAAMFAVRLNNGSTKG